LFRRSYQVSSIRYRVSSQPVLAGCVNPCLILFARLNDKSRRTFTLRSGKGIANAAKEGSADKAMAFHRNSFRETPCRRTPKPSKSLCALCFLFGQNSFRVNPCNPWLPLCLRVFVATNLRKSASEKFVFICVNSWLIFYPFWCQNFY